MQPDPDASTTPAQPAAPRPLSSSWRTIGRALAPRATRAQLMAGLLCALLGFALVVQVRQTRSEGLANLPQDELVRVLDEVTQRSETLQRQAATLQGLRSELLTGSDTQRAARDAAQERATVEGILAGRLPAEGPGVELTIREPEDRIPALVMFNLLEELRNAGAEAIQLGDVRLTASTYFRDVADGIEVDGTTLHAPYHWLVIGDPEVITPALNVPGGALAQVRGATGATDLQTKDLVEVTAVRDLPAPTFATPAPETPAG